MKVIHIFGLGNSCVHMLIDHATSLKMGIMLYPRPLSKLENLIFVDAASLQLFMTRLFDLSWFFLSFVEGEIAKLGSA